MIAPGHKIDEYEIQEVIGRGAMGVVYKARSPRFEEPVALKVLNESLSHSPEYIERLYREAETAARVDSPHVVRILDKAEFDGGAYIVMEYVEGVTLQETTDRLDFAQKTELALQIAEGLRAAHDSRVVHADLKPENIRVTPEGRAKILDFGLAKTISTDSVDSYGNIEGTLYYLSPEQISGDPLDFRSDLFSFGVILYEFFTGVRPFEGEYSAAIIYSILHEDQAPPSDIAGDLPAWCDEIIGRLLAKNPEARYKSAAKLLEHLNSCSDGEPLTGVSPDVWSRRTVTVIDLKNLSDDKEWNYFCRGFTDDLINELSRSSDLIVSAEPATGYHRNIHEIFSSCRTDYVISGSLAKTGGDIKLHLSLYGDSGDNLIIAKNYVDKLGDIFDILEHAVVDMAGELTRIAGGTDVRVDEYFNVNVSAYDYYLKGKSYYQIDKPEQWPFAEEMYKKSLDCDPGFALAHSGLSDIYALQYSYYLDRTTAKIDMARNEAEAAIAIAPNLPEAHRSLGRYYMFTGNFDRARESFLKAVDINPKYATGYRTLAWLCEISGNHARALNWARLSLKYDPNNLETLLLLSLINMDLNKHTIAMSTLRRAIELAPDYGRAYHELATVYLRLGLLDMAEENYISAIRYKGDPNSLNDLAFVLIARGKHDAARDYLEQSHQQGFMPFISFYYQGFSEHLQGHDGEARDFHEKAVASCREYIDKDPENLHIMAYYALALAAAGRHDQARNILADLETKGKDNGDILYNVARAYVYTQQPDKARQILSESKSAHAGPTEPEIGLDPHFKDLA